MYVCIGGTFNYLHKGHKYLISKAFEVAGENGSVFIGLTTTNIINNKKNIKSFNDRKKNLEIFLSENNFLEKSIIRPIKNKYGPSVEEDFDAIVVSPETSKTAEEINTIRVKKNKKPLKIVIIDFVLAKDGIPISSTRIKNKEIDNNGNLIDKA
jgi:pantetheine-phosphate adenylyltransferase